MCIIVFGIPGQNVSLDNKSGGFSLHIEVETFFQGPFYFYGIEMVKWFLQGIHAF